MTQPISRQLASTRRIRLLLLIPHLGGGGAERVTAQLARWLDPERFELHLVLCTPDGPGARAEELPKSVTVHRIGASRVRHAAMPIVRLVKKLQPDAILSNMAHLNFLVLALRPLLPAGTRILIRQNTTASAAAKTMLTRLAYRQLCPRADAILCQSQAMAADLHRHFGIARKKLAVFPNPIDIAEIREAVAEQNTAPHWPAQAWPRLLSVGRLSHEKGYDLLLTALRTVRALYPRTRLAILGAGPEEATLRRLSHESGFSDAVDLPGYVNSPAEWFAEATLYVQPSRLEGMPNALLEAAAAGLPVLSTPSSRGVSALLGDAPGTWVAGEVSAESLGQAVLRALSALSDGVAPADRLEPVRFEHAFLDPFESRVAAAACGTLIESVVATGTVGAQSASWIEEDEPAPEHVAFVIPTIDAIGGAERQVLNLAMELRSRGLRVTLIALSGSGGEQVAELARSSVNFFSLNMRRSWVDPRGWFRYLRWAQANRPAIVHAHLPHATWFARWMRLLAPVRIEIDTIHTSATGTATRKLGYRLSNWLTNRVTCVSDAAAQAALAARMVTANKLTVLPNGVPLPQNSPLPNLHRNPDSFRWISVGRLDKVKDHASLLCAFAALPQGPVKATLAIVGDGPMRVSLRELAERLRIDDRVLFTGFQQDVASLLAISEAFVLSSLWEGLPVSVLEAQAAGLPVVATDAAGTAQAMVSGETGLLAPVGDVAALAGAMAQVMAMTEHDRLEMGARGRAFVEEKFSLAAVVSRWQELYKELLEANPRSSRWTAKKRRI
jgi:glycosyltransferase involved in cell wall biosynthesis